MFECVFIILDVYGLNVLFEKYGLIEWFKELRYNYLLFVRKLFKFIVLFKLIKGWINLYCVN